MEVLYFYAGNTAIVGGSNTQFFGMVGVQHSGDPRLRNREIRDAYESLLRDRRLEFGTYDVALTAFNRVGP